MLNDRNRLLRRHFWGSWLMGSVFVCACGSGGPGQVAGGVGGAAGASFVAAGTSAAGSSACGGSPGPLPEATGGSGWSRPAVPEVKPHPGVGQPCQPGSAYACACPDGSTGSMGCVAAPEEFTACGCAGTAEYPGQTCGANRCPYLTVDGIEFTGAHCCTSDDECGMKNSSIFNDTCYARFAEHYGERDDECDQPIAFVETRGCCRPDNQCGLVLLTGSNWDELGCVEAVDLANRMKQSLTLGLFLFGTGNAGALDRIQARSCRYDGGNDGSYKPERYLGARVTAP